MTSSDGVPQVRCYRVHRGLGQEPIKDEDDEDEPQEDAEHMIPPSPPPLAAVVVETPTSLVSLHTPLVWYKESSFRSVD